MYRDLGICLISSLLLSCFGLIIRRVPLAVPSSFTHIPRTTAPPAHHFSLQCQPIPHHVLSQADASPSISGKDSILDAAASGDLYLNSQESTHTFMYTSRPRAIISHDRSRQPATCSGAHSRGQRRQPPRQRWCGRLHVLPLHSLRLPPASCICLGRPDSSARSMLVIPRAHSASAAGIRHRSPLLNNSPMLLILSSQPLSPSHHLLDCMQRRHHSRARYAGADVRAVEAKDGDSALHWAVFQGQEDIVRMLLEVQRNMHLARAPSRCRLTCCRLVLT
jgi:hypothetical protein